MLIIFKIVCGLLALIHLYILWLEMFAWTTRGPKVFKSIPKDIFQPTKVLAANQGLYNGFLAAGLIWSLCIGDPLWSVRTGQFFLACIMSAGVYGALTAQRSIFFVQALPAMIGLLASFYI
jgi:putative membrane protein